MKNNKLLSEKYKAIVTAINESEKALIDLMGMDDMSRNSIEYKTLRNIEQSLESKKSLLRDVYESLLKAE